ncbi:DNA primase large subunit PriL [Methanocaldococcus lauensis]|nr:DNA primase large subunit PriL [Methanocaldococcus lauensis]
MLLEYLEEFKDIDFLESIKKYRNLILSKLRYIYEKNEEYKKDLKLYLVLDNIDKKKLEALIDYLLIILLSHTNYFNSFIKEYSEIKKYDLIKKLPNKISVWEFIKTASKSRNNDLHLERLDLENGYVDITEIKKIYAREFIRVELKHLGELAKNVKLPDDEIVKDLLKEINDYLKDKVKYEYTEEIKVNNNILCENIPLGWHPPCIRGILHDILSGGSPSHYARRSFVVYWFCAKFNPNLRPLDKEGNLINVSATDITSEENIEKFIDEVIEIFKNVEDFDENKTRYYIMHNIGYKVGHGRFTHCEYCKNWKSDDGKGLSYYCKPDNICKKRNIIHPLDYLCYNINRHLKLKKIKKSKSLIKKEDKNGNNK